MLLYSNESVEKIIKTKILWLETKVKDLKT